MENSQKRKKVIVAAVQCLFVGTAYATSYTSTVTATPGSPVALLPGDTVATSGAAGVVAQGSGATLTADQVGITTTGNIAWGANATQGGSVSLTGGRIDTDGTLSNGAGADQGGRLQINGATVNTTGRAAFGIAATGNGSTVNVQNVNVTTSGTFFVDATVHTAAGIAAVNGGAVVLGGSNNITTHGSLAQGLLAETTEGGSPASIQVSGTTTIITTGGTGHAVEAAGVGATISGSGINATTNGSNAIGIYTNEGVVTLSSSSFTTKGSTSAGIQAVGGGKVTLSDSSLTTSGDTAPGATAQQGAAISLSNVTVSTQGQASDGLVAAGVGSTLNGIKATVTTSGENAAAIGASHGGAVMLSGSSLTANGANAAGLVVRQGVHGETDASHITLDATSLTSAQAEAIRVVGTNANIDLKNGSTLKPGNGLILNVSSAGGVAGTANLNADGSIVLVGDVQAAAGNTANVSLANGSSLTGAVSNGGTVAIGASSGWTMTKNSDVQVLNLNGGAVSFQSSSTGFKTLTAGSLGGSGGTVNMNAVLNDGGANTQSDLLAVTGGVTGQHALAVTNQGGSGEQTVGDGIKLVQVQGSASGGAFQLARPVQAGAYEYLLYQGGASAPSQDWFLRSQLADPAAPPNGGSLPPAFRPAVPGYVLMPAFNRDYGFTTLGRLHERVGDVPTLDSDGRLRGDDAVWGRVGGQNLRADSGRFSGDENTFFAQFGKDWTVARDSDGGSTHAGATVTFGTANADFSDKLRSLYPKLSTHTGSADMQAQSVGGYVTRYLGDGTYLDGVGQLTHFRNEYGDSSGTGATQNGYGLALSGEVGKPFVLAANGFAIEPQAQLMYQYLSLNDFNDGVSSVSSDAQHALRGRIGVRAFGSHFETADKTGVAVPQFTVDVLHDFVSSADTTIGGTTFTPDMAETWYELGLGLSAAFAKDKAMYINIKYAHNIGGDDRESVYGQAGLRYSW